MKNLILLTSIVLCTIDVNAQWQQVSFGGQYVECLVSDSSYLYIGTEYDGVYLSKDCGATWEQANNGLPIDMFTNISQLKVMGSNIIATTFDGNIGSIYLSNNNGYSWSEIHNGLPINSYIASIATTDSIIFVTTFNNDGTAQENNAAFYSTNHGANWTSLSTPTVCKPQVIEVKDSKIFIDMWGCGLYLSNNLGATWSYINNNDPLAIAIKDSLIFIGTGNGVFLSTNNGGLWTPVNNGLTQLNIYCVKVVGTTVFAVTYSNGMFYSTNNGNLWIPFNDGITNVYTINIEICNNNLFAGNSEGLWNRSYSDITLLPKIDTDNSDLILSPNPSNGKFVIKNSTKIKSIEVINMLGKNIYHSIPDISQLINEINLTNAPKGIYFVKIDIGEKIKIEKIVLN